MLRFERVKHFIPWFFLALIIGLAAFIRGRINFAGPLMPGVNGPYYPVQVRSILETGRLGFPDFPLVFYLEALVARLLFALRLGSFSDCIMWASKGFDAVFPTLAAVPVYLLARDWLKKEGRLLWLALVTAGFPILYFFALFITADLQKQSAGAVWLLGYFYFLNLALQNRSRRSLTGAGIFLVLTGLTHVGCLGVAIIFSVIVGATLLLSERTSRRAVLLGTGGLLLLLGTVAGGIWLFFDPARIERLLSVFSLPAELFKHPMFLDLGNPYTSPSFFISSVILILGAALLIRRWKTIEPAQRALVLAAVLTTLLLVFPFFGGEWATRLNLLAYLPATVLLVFLFSQLRSRAGRLALTAGVFLLLILSVAGGLSRVGRPASISEDSFGELKQLRSVVTQPEQTLLVARHGLEWWAAWVLETDVTQIPSLSPEVWEQYAQVLYLVQLAGSADFGPPSSGPSGRPFPEVVIPPGAEILFEGEYFRLARAVQTSTLDPQKEKTHLSKVAETPGVYWVRGFDLFWNEIEKEQGKFDWAAADEKIREFGQREIYPLVIVKPFANWDQDRCHPEERYIAEYDPAKGGRVKVGKPCDLAAYAQFLEKAVERYDGDGENDMPGLTVPIKYWEILNEPEMQGGSTGGMGEELKFFVGTPAEYLEILRISYQTIRQADPTAKVVHAGMAGVQENFRDFWEPVFAGGGGDYTDAYNIHTISTNAKREDLYVVRFKRFLAQFNLPEKPIWITEVQYGSLTQKPANLKDFEVLMAKSSALALALGADKLFYIENWLYWESDWKEKGKVETSTHKVYLNLVEKVNDFDWVVMLKERYQENPRDDEGVTSQVGQYKFLSGSKAVYVLWGPEALPAEIAGKVRVTDIYGESRVVEAKDLVLSEEPLFVELLD